MKASVTLQEGMHFVATADTGFTVDLDASPAVGGADGGFRPLELLAMSLVGCTGMDVISILRKMRQDIIGFKVNFDADHADTHPKVFTEIRVEYEIKGKNIDQKMVERAVELSAERYCPVQAMLEQAVPIKHTYKIVESE
ncbi:MAG: OsmC family peroxiredoxin [Chloroflexi bacterium]|nr:MAG: OsmC family peroxiredoxin [Chloroflexota bacterium]